MWASCVGNRQVFLINATKFRYRIQEQLGPVLSDPTRLILALNVVQEFETLKKEFKIFLIAVLDVGVVYKLTHQKTNDVGFSDIMEDYFGKPHRF